MADHRERPVASVQRRWLATGDLSDAALVMYALRRRDLVIYVLTRQPPRDHRREPGLGVRASFDAGSSGFVSSRSARMSRRDLVGPGNALRSRPRGTTCRGITTPRVSRDVAAAHDTAPDRTIAARDRGSRPVEQSRLRRLVATSSFDRSVAVTGDNLYGSVARRLATSEV